MKALFEFLSLLTTFAMGAVFAFIGAVISEVNLPLGLAILFFDLLLCLTSVQVIINSNSE